MRARERESVKWFVYSSGIFLYFPFFSELDVGLESVQMAKCHHQQKRQLLNQDARLDVSTTTQQDKDWTKSKYELFTVKIKHSQST